MTIFWIRKRQQYKRVYSKGRKEVGRHLILYTWLHGRDEQRFGITVTRKIGTAVVRNRAKRRIREVIRQKMPVLSVGGDFVVVVRKGMTKASFHEVRDELLHLVRKYT